MAKRFKDTLNLPRTGFPMRANAREREPQLQRICVTELWKWQRAARGPEAPSPAAPFVLHDGPPYANGPLHIGHALNKILKDVINRYKMLRGHRIDYTPGWDCHGLPIELKALQQDRERGQAHAESGGNGAGSACCVATSHGGDCTTWRGRTWGGGAGQRGHTHTRT